MTLKFIKSLWGFEMEDPDALILRLQGAGYEGVEAPLFVNTTAYRDAGLEYVAQGFCETCDSLAEAVEGAVDTGAVLLNIQLGKDFWSLTTAVEFLSLCRPIVEGSPVPVVFETHRGRLFSSAASTAEVLREHPWVRLCADFSHWTCVSESLLFDQEEAVGQAAQHTDYIHARIGHAQGAQVGKVDPRSEETSRFLGWWKQILSSSTLPVFRIDPEFGPAPYQIQEGDLWSLCFKTMSLIREELRQ
jgi:hypothetical protein